MVIVGGWYGTFSLRRAKANQYLAAGDEYFSQGNDRQAIIEYKKAVFLYSTGDTYFALGQSYFLNQNYSTAESYFKKAIAKDENQAKARFGMGETYLYQQKYGEALKILEEKNLNDPLIKLGLTRVYLCQEKDEQAEKQIEGRDDDLGKFYQAKILLFQQQYSLVPEKLDQIEANDGQEIRSMLPAEPSSADVKTINEAANQSLKTSNPATRLVIFGETLNQTGDAVIALPILKKVAEENATYRDALVFLGHSWMLVKNYNEAKEILLQAIDLDQVYYPSWLYLGQAYQGLENTEAADKCFEKAEKLK